MLYHLPDPTVALREAHRVLRAGGLFGPPAPSRDDSPELACFLPPAAPVSFDAEVAAGLLGGVFGQVEVQRWNLPLRLPDRPAVRDYLVGVFLAGRGLAERVAAQVEVPLVVTKLGRPVLRSQGRPLTAARRVQKLVHEACRWYSWSRPPRRSRRCTRR